MLFVFLIITGCALFKRQEPLLLSPEDNRIKETIAIVNSRIHTNYGKANKGKFTQFNQEAYEKNLKPLTSAQAKNMQDLYPIFKTKEFRANSKTFVFCGFSERLGIAFCDDAACPGTEFFERTTSASALTKWLEQLPLKSCSTK